MTLACVWPVSVWKTLDITLLSREIQINKNNI